MIKALRYAFHLLQRMVTIVVFYAITAKKCCSDERQGEFYRAAARRCSSPFVLISLFVEHGNELLCVLLECGKGFVADVMLHLAGVVS